VLQADHSWEKKTLGITVGTGALASAAFGSMTPAGIRACRSDG